MSEPRDIPNEELKNVAGGGEKYTGEKYDQYKRELKAKEAEQQKKEEPQKKGI